MKQILTILLLCLTIFQTAAQRINRTYHDQSLSEVLKDLNDASSRFEVSFIYNELEDFRVTTTLHRSTLPNAVRQVVGFYPMRVTETDSMITVECTHKTDLHLTGTIIDEQDRPVAYANITVLNPADSTILCGGVSNESGVFVIPIDQENVIARISYVGYKTIWRVYNHAKVGIVRLQRENQQLKGITVEGQSPILRREAGTIIFDTRHVVGAVNTTDLLRYTPGVMIDDNTVSLFGTSGVVFRIDGKEQRMGIKEMLLMLKSYAASEVERIEIINSPSAQYSAEWNAGIINIVLKKHGNDYIGGTAAYARTQYEEHGDEINASIIYNRDKVSTSLNLAGVWDHSLYCETNDVNFTDNLRHGIDDGLISNDNYSLRWQTDYSVSDKLNLGTYVMYTNGKRHLAIDGLYDYMPKRPYTESSIDTQTRRQEDTKSWAANVNAVLKINDEGGKIDYNLDYYRMRMGDARHSFCYNNYMDSDNHIQQTDTAVFDYINDIILNVDNYSAKVDISYGFFRIGSQYIYTHSRLDLNYSGSMSRSYNHVSTSYDERVLSGYIEYKRAFGNVWSLNIGGRYEHRFFPSLYIAYRPNHSHSFNWSLGSRITRPNIINLNPNRVWKDVNHESFGNQNLKPTYLYKVVMGYSYKGMLSFDLFYSYQPERIDPIYLVEKQVTYTSWDNITNEHSIGINSVYDFIRLRWMKAILTQGICYMKTIRPERELFPGVIRQYSTPKVESIFYTGMLQASFSFDRHRRWMANLNATYNSPEKDVTKALNARYMVDVGLQYSLWKDRLKISLSCRNLLASHIRGTEYLGTTPMDFDNKFNYRQLRLTITYNWGARLRHDQRQYESDDMRRRIVNDF